MAASRRAFCLFSLQTADDQNDFLLPALQCNVPVGLQQPIVDVSWLPEDNGLIISSHQGGLIHLWESGSLSIIDTIRLACKINGHALSSPSGVSPSAMAVAHDKGVVLVDLRAGSAVQTFAMDGQRPISLTWSPQSVFSLYSGCLDGSIQRLDIRKPRGSLMQVLTPSASVTDSGYPFFLDWIGPDSMVGVHGSGFAFLLSPSAQEIIWRSDLGFYCLEGFRGALVDETVHQMLVMPGTDCISALNLQDGSEMWRKPCLGFTSDALLYNPVRYVRSLGGVAQLFLS